MPTRNLTAAEADEIDTRKRLRAAKQQLEAKQQALVQAQAQVRQAKTAFDDARNEYLRKFGNPL